MINFKNDDVESALKWFNSLKQEGVAEVLPHINQTDSATIVAYWKENIEPHESEWTDCSVAFPPEDGKYLCYINNGNREFEAVRLLKKGHWFGGCRPFSDNEEILKWKKV